MYLIVDSELRYVYMCENTKKFDERMVIRMPFDTGQFLIP